LLINLAPLPLMVVGLVWGPLSAAVGGIAATVVIAALFGLPYCIAFALVNVLPAWWLAHLVLLARQRGGAAAAGPNEELEWYPVGRILIWILVFATIITAATLLMMGTDAAAIQSTIRKGWVELLETAGLALNDSTLDTLVVMAPMGAEMAAMAMLTLNLWLAAKIAATSGRLHRPWPDLKSIALPTVTIAALFAAVICCFAGGLLAILAQVLTAGLSIVYAMTGFAVLHTLTLAMKSRALWLGCAYAVVAGFAWALLAVALLGVADAVFGLRQRYLRSRPPPLPKP
jgi:membrane-associated HD superfamily phosphohydrolase